MNNQITLLGAGKLGVTLAQLAIKAGYEVVMAGSGTPTKIALSIKVLVPGASVSSVRDAVVGSDIVILALPLSKYRSIPSEALAGKLVVDAMNYWWEVDGDRSSLLGGYDSSSEMVQEFLPKSRVAKALSHMGYHHLSDESRPNGVADRKAIAVAGNNPDDVAAVSRLIDRLGFDPLTIGDLTAGKLLEPGHPAFGANTSAKLLKEIIFPTNL